MKRPVKSHLESMQALPFILSIHPVGDMTFMLPYLIPITSNIKACEIDLYLPTGRKRVADHEEGNVYVYDEHMKQVKNQVDLHSYEYRYKYTICNT